MNGGVSIKIVLWSTDCPKCVILKKKLDAKEIEYTIIDNTDEMIKKGLMTVPVLEVGDSCLTFEQANNWINEQE